MHIAYLGIGSNLGNRIANCEKAVSMIANLPNTSVIKQSNWLDNRALSIDSNCNHPDFINGAIEITTSLNPQSLLTSIKNIEEDMGRDLNSEKWSPRIIDIDILFFDDIVFKSSDLQIPHKEANKRVFVLKPMCDIAPDLKHPTSGHCMSKLLKSLTKSEK